MMASRKTLLALIAINTLVYLFYVRVFSARGLDFQAFYFAGKTITQAPAQLYDLDYQRLSHRERFGDQREFRPFFHPPHEILLFLLFSTLPYAASLTAWRVFSLLCLVGSGLFLGRALGVDRILTATYVVAMYPVGMCLFQGQDSALLLLLVCGSFCLLKEDRNVPAALLLSVALFKPLLPVVLAIALLAAGRTKFFAWFAGASAALAAASIAFVRRAGIQQLLQGEKLAEQNVDMMPSVRGLTAFVFGDHPWLVYGLVAIAVVTMLTVWRRSKSLDFVVGSAICTGCTFIPYIRIYDLVVLAVPLILITRKPRKHDGAIGAILTSGILLLILIFFKASALLVIPTLALGVMTFRLASPIREPVTELAAQTGLK